MVASGFAAEAFPILAQCRSAMTYFIGCLFIVYLHPNDPSLFLFCLGRAFEYFTKESLFNL